MDITESKVGETGVLSVAGRVDGSVSKELEERLGGALKSGKLVVNLAEMNYISSAGLRALLVAAKTAKASGTPLALAGLTQNVRDVFDMSGFTALFKIHASTDEAVAALG